ncbi:hypothetical protein ACGFYZ_25940 [Streptomyces sp. NPDC048330]|uniref:hypothetical protein n=1 Tax=Streptomyces sp. NPDC048330 TaxID=3365533 RepID=UPI0037238758
MNTENARSQTSSEPAGCLTGVARAIALVIVLPVRLVWDALAYCLKQLWRWVLAPIGRVLAWLIHHLLVIPLRFLWEWVIAPVGRALWWLVDLLVVTPLRWLGRWVLLPVAKAVWWLVDLLLVTPLTWLWRHVLAPVGRAAGAAAAWAWHIGGLISGALGRAVAWLLWNTVGRPLAWVYRVILTPVGHWLRTWVWAPVAAVTRAVRAAAREVRVALFGGPR